MNPIFKAKAKDDDDTLNTSFAPQPVIHQDESEEAQFSRWLSVEQIRKMQRMRRETVVAAMLDGELPYEQRGRIRYARFADVLAWEERRLNPESAPSRMRIAPELADLVG
tara:strand:+ start:230691 stop:231020 length:330 start_codon:yes stop_codon:yes gene_type:complete